MMYLAVIFVSPLYFMIRGKWGAFFLNSVFYGAAVMFLLTFVGAFLAPIPWGIAAIHAVMEYRKELVNEAAGVMATKMAEAMRQNPPTLS